MNPLVSIIMPAYNAERYIASAIQSVLDQKYENWELLIINDGSTDSTQQIINSYANELSIRTFDQKNKGVSSARNVGLDNMQGEYFCFLDADDQLTNISISLRMQIFNNNPNLSFVDGGVQLLDETFETVKEERIQDFEGNPFSALIQIDTSCFFGPSWLIKRQKEIKYHFHTDLTHCEDLYFYICISQTGGNYTAIKDIIYRYRTGNNSAMNDLRRLSKGYKKVTNKLIKMGVPKRLQSIFKAKTRTIMFKCFLSKGQFHLALKEIIS